MRAKLEIFRMMVYLSFPIGMFWYSNQAEYFEEYVIKRKREIFPNETEEKKKQLREFREEMRKIRREKLLQAAEK